MRILCAALILGLAGCASSPDDAPRRGGYDTLQDAGTDALARRDYGDAQRYFASAAGIARTTPKKIHSLLGATIAGMGAEDWTAAERSMLKIMDVAATEPVPREMLADAMRMRATIQRAQTQAFAEADAAGRFDDGRLDARSGWAIDPATGDLLHAVSGARYPRRAGDLAMRFYGLNRSDGSDMNLHYAAPGTTATISLFQFESDEDYAAHADHAAALIERRYRRVAPSRASAVSLPRRDFGALRGRSVALQADSAEGVLTEVVSVYDARPYLLKLRVTAPAEAAPRVLLQAAALLQTLSPPR